MKAIEISDEEKKKISDDIDSRVKGVFEQVESRKATEKAFEEFNKDVKSNNIPAVEKYFANGGEVSNVFRDETLRLANSPEMIKLLIKNGALIENNNGGQYDDDSEDHSFLIDAIEELKADQVAVYLQCGADPEFDGTWAYHGEGHSVDLAVKWIEGVAKQEPDFLESVTIIKQMIEDARNGKPREEIIYEDYVKAYENNQQQSAEQPAKETVAENESAPTRTENKLLNSKLEDVYNNTLNIALQAEEIDQNMINYLMDNGAKTEFPVYTYDGDLVTTRSLLCEKIENLEVQAVKALVIGGANVWFSSDSAVNGDRPFDHGVDVDDAIENLKNRKEHYEAGNWLGEEDDENYKKFLESQATVTIAENTAEFYAALEVLAENEKQLIVEDRKYGEVNYNSPVLCSIYDALTYYDIPSEELKNYQDEGDGITAYTSDGFISWKGNIHEVMDELTEYCDARSHSYTDEDEIIADEKFSRLSSEELDFLADMCKNDCLYKRDTDDITDEDISKVKITDELLNKVRLKIKQDVSKAKILADRIIDETEIRKNLENAIKENDCEKVETLLSQGAVVSNIFGEESLREADTPEMIKILVKNGALIENNNCANYDDYLKYKSFLVGAIDKVRPDKVAAYIQCGADVNFDESLNYGCENESVNLALKRIQNKEDKKSVTIIKQMIQTGGIEHGIQRSCQKPLLVQKVQ